MTVAAGKKEKKRCSFPSLRGQSGSVLIFVAWSMALLGFMAISSGASGGFSLGVASRLERDLEAYGLARSAVPYVIQLLEEDETPKYDGPHDSFLRADETLFSQFPLGRGNFSLYYETPNPRTGYKEKRFGLEDEERKLNLNTAGTDTVVSLFQFAGLDAEEALAMADRIADWLDEDNQRRDGGAERFEYQALKEPYECKNAPFESIEELLLIYGMTPEVYEKIRPYVTVYGSGKINLNTAYPAVLTILGLSDIGVNGMLLYRSGPDGKDGTDDDLSLHSLQGFSSELGAYVPAEDLVKIGKLVQDGLVGISSEAFRFTAEARLDITDHRYKVHVVTKRDGEILSWQES